MFVRGEFFRVTDDFFAFFGEQRRPWLDPERVKETFHQLSRTEHPDQQTDGEGDFARLNQAQAVLRDPKLRLRHLLELEHPEVKLSGPSGIPTGLADLFVAVHGLLREADAVLAKKAAANSALAKALLAREEFAAREKVEAILEQLDALQAEATAELQAFDARWLDARPPDAAAALHEFYQQFAYLSRWLEQLRERLFQLGA